MSYILTGKVGTGDNLLYSQAGTPALDLRFASTKSLTDFVTQQNLVTFTRASSATYVGSDGLIKTAAVNEPRFDHDPTTGESLGLLVEEQRTNLQGHSELLTAASWDANGATVAASGAGPNGRSAYELIETNALGVHAFAGGGVGAASSTSVTIGSVYTGSIFLKRSTVDWIQLSFGSVGFGSTNYINFNLATGVIGNSTGFTGTITPFPNGWYRCTVTGTATATTTITNNIAIFFTNNTNTTSRLPNYTGSTSNKVLATMGQFEPGGLATSYILTATAAVTRSADVASITGTNFSSWYRQDEGTVFAETQQLGDILGFVFAVSDGTDNNRIAQFRNGTTLSNRNVRVGTAANPGNITIASSQQLVRSAVASVAGSCGAAANGVLATDSAPAALPTVNRLQIALGVSGSPLNGTIRRLAFFPQRLPNSTLQAITQ